eukprot:4756387-Pyramimonas_sp.AAC.1
MRAHNCQKCARRKGVLAECAVARGMSVFSLWLDMQQAHEQVRHKLLIRRAAQSGFIRGLLRAHSSLYRSPRVVYMPAPNRRDLDVF